MQILVVATWWPFPPNNGSKIRLYYLLRALSVTHRVTLVAFCPEAEMLTIEPGDALNNVRVVPVRADPFRHVNAPPPVKYVSPIPLMCWPSPEMQRAVQQAAQSEKFDGVVAYQLPVGQYALQLSHTPRVFEIDTALSFQMRERYQRGRSGSAHWRTWLSWQKAERYEKRLVRQYQAVTVSGPMELDYLSSFGVHTELLPNGVDCERNRPGLVAAEPNTLVYAGALTYSANYDAMQYFLAEIYPLIKQRVLDVTLTITGSLSGVDRSGLRLDDSVQLPGRVEDIRPLVAGSAVSIAPIRRGAGTRLKILEAMALGTPVISTSKGAEGLNVIDGEHMLIADEPEQFAARTVQLLRDAGLRQLLVGHARRLVEERYDWNEIGRRFNELVEATAQQAGR
jgi:polysaccharide biosynthesis protein PslH